jgi:outer membrane receptor protein involved in Fe transport
VAWPLRLAFVSAPTTLTPSASFTAYRGDDLSGASSIVAPGTPLDSFPGHALRVSLEATSRLGPVRGSLSATVLSSFAQDRQSAGALADEAYTVVGLRAGVTWREPEHQRELRLAVAVDNLFNATYHPLQSPLPAKGRDVKLSIQARF